MIIPETHFTLKDGRDALLRSPCETDAAEMLAFIIQASGETDFLLKYPEEYASYTMEMETAFLRGAAENPDGAMLICVVDGRIAGSCQISFMTDLKQRHRAGVAIGLLKEYWNLGAGTKMLQELLNLAAARGGIRQVELDFIEGNARARHLYEKMGFRITGIKQDAVMLKDGQMLNEYMMIKKIGEVPGVS